MDNSYFFLIIFLIPLKIEILDYLKNLNSFAAFFSEIKKLLFLKLMKKISQKYL